MTKRPQVSRFGTQIEVWDSLQLDLFVQGQTGRPVGQVLGTDRIRPDSHEGGGAAERGGGRAVRSSAPGT